jgi:hypothetical protein
VFVLCSCNRDERRCEPEPLETGTPCGVDGDYYFGTCNQGPGFCKKLDSEFGDYGICVGVPKFGAPCDDYNRCTKNDKCKVVRTDDGLLRGQCMGKFDETLPCNDYDDECTINDRYGCCASLMLSVFFSGFLFAFFPPPRLVLWQALLLHGLIFCLWLILGSCPVDVSPSLMLETLY